MFRSTIFLLSPFYLFCGLFHVIMEVYFDGYLFPLELKQQVSHPGGRLRQLGY